MESSQVRGAVARSLSFRREDSATKGGLETFEGNSAPRGSGKSSRVQGAVALSLSFRKEDTAGMGGLETFESDTAQK